MADSGFPKPKAGDQGIESWLISIHPTIYDMLQSLIIDLKRRKVCGSHAVATRTTLLLRNMLGTCYFSTAGEAIRTLRCIGRTLLRAQPHELVAASAVRRILHIIREYAAKHVSDKATIEPTSPSLFSLDALTPGAEVAFKHIRNNILDDVHSEIIPELEGLASAASPIYEYANEYIHNREVILTFGYSKTVENFLKAAAWGWSGLQRQSEQDNAGGRIKRNKKREFEVIVAESAPDFGGQKLALKLSSAGIETTVITDSAVFALMARVNKVIVGSHAIMADGGLIAQSGMHMVALAANHQSVPMVCVSGLYKLCPVYRHSKNGGTAVLNHMLSPSAVLSFEESDFAMQNVEVLNPAFDVIPANLVDLIVTTDGGVTPSYIYRLLQENYAREDYSLEEASLPAS